MGFCKYYIGPICALGGWPSVAEYDHDVCFTGAVLHVHEGSMLDVHWLIKNATYDPLCFMCTNRSSGVLQFHFFDKPPTSNTTG